MKEINQIIIIDDDPIIAFGLKKLIKLTGINSPVESFINGKLAFDYFTKQLASNSIKTDIIYLDINMPIMDGWEFLKAFIQLKLNKQITINILTSSIDPYDKAQWEHYKEITSHIITYNKKPITREKMEYLTKLT